MEISRWWHWHEIKWFHWTGNTISGRPVSRLRVGQTVELVTAAYILHIVSRSETMSVTAVGVVNGVAYWYCDFLPLKHDCSVRLWSEQSERSDLCIMHLGSDVQKNAKRGHHQLTDTNARQERQLSQTNRAVMINRTGNWYTHIDIGIQNTENTEYRSNRSNTEFRLLLLLRIVFLISFCSDASAHSKL